MEQISPEAFKAQRMAELKDIAEWRARHLQYVKDWSDPVKRAQIQADIAFAEKVARKIESMREVLPAQPLRPLADILTIVPVFKPQPKKRSWLARLFGRK